MTPGHATAIIAAAGLGERLGEAMPKALVEVGGVPLFQWSVQALQAAQSIGEIVIAVPAGHERAFEGCGASVVPGGASRSESVSAALELVTTAAVVVHDAARPLVDPELFDAVLQTLDAESCDAVVAATPVTDTIKEVARAREVDRTLDRSSLWAAQTPQAFRAEALRNALASTSLLAQATDDALLVERIGGRVVLHEAPRENFKVTTPLDLRLAELLLAERG